MQSITLDWFELIAINFVLKFDYWNFAWTLLFSVEASAVKCSDTSMSIYRRFKIQFAKLEAQIGFTASKRKLFAVQAVRNPMIASTSSSHSESFSRAFLLSIFKRTWLSLRKLCHSIMHAGCNIYHSLRFLPNSWLQLQHSSPTPRHRRGRHHSRAAYCLHNPWFASFCYCSH